MDQLRTPAGYDGVTWADEVVHAIDMGGLHDDRPLWREPAVCGRAGPGVSSDEGGPAALHQRFITCWECISILA
jgi:hypothetical protein